MNEGAFNRPPSPSLLPSRSIHSSRGRRQLPLSPPPPPLSPSPGPLSPSPPQWRDLEFRNSERSLT